MIDQEKVSETYICTGLIDAFDITFPYEQDQGGNALYIDVYHNGTLLTEGVDYTISQDVVTTVLTYPEPDEIELKRNTDILQPTSFLALGRVDPRELEAVADRLTLIAQEAGARDLIPGPEGPAGLQGNPGIQGIQGEPGATGATGDTGPRGIQGLKGDIGNTGATGETGETGAQGIQGLQGSKGDTGAKGDTGPQGEQGEQGVQGFRGDTGLQGIQGEQGIQGIDGPSVESVAFVGDDMVFTKDNLETVTMVDAKIDLKGDQGIQGIQGEQGIQGVPGVDADLQRVNLEGLFNEAYNDHYYEITYTSGDVTAVEVWENNTKVTKLFTKNIYYTSGDVSSVLITDEITGATLENVISYNVDGDVESVTKEMVEV